MNQKRNFTAIPRARSTLFESLAFSLVILSAASVSAQGSETSVWENFSFSGRLHPQVDSLESRVVGNEFEQTLKSEKVFMRRVFAGVKFDASSTVRLNYLTDISDSNVKNQIARVEWTLNDRSKFYLGYQKVPFIHEDTTSSASVKPIERSASTRFWNEVVGLGSYHSGAYLYNNYENGYSSVLGLTHNVKGHSDWPDVMDGKVAGYVRLNRSGTNRYDIDYLMGVDLAYKPDSNNGDLLALSSYVDWALGDYDLKLEGVVGRIDESDSNVSEPKSWHLQVSRMLGEKFEPVIRFSQVNSDGYAVKFSSLVRKAPFSGYRYNKVDSLYLGFSYYVSDNDLKVSAGYEYAKAEESSDSNVYEETISGFRVRGQLMF